MTREQAAEAIHHKITTEEQLGTRAGGSGHLGNTTYTLFNISIPEKTTNGWQVAYSFTLITETEFTIYPDNPPYESSYRVVVLLNNKGEIIEELQKEAIQSSLDDQIETWVMASENDDVVDNDFITDIMKSLEDNGKAEDE